MGKKIQPRVKASVPEKRKAKITPKAKVAPAPAEVKPRPKRKLVPTKRAVAARRQTKIAAFTNDDVALRAYFIAEKRNANGLPGDTHQDWLEAERQLMAEASSGPPPRAKARIPARKKAANLRQS
jgi:hypothetical protein